MKLIPIAFVLLSCSSLYAQPSPTSGYGVDVRQFGARGDGVTDDTNAIQRALDSRPEGRMALYFPATAASYLVTHTVHIRKDRINLIGDGAQASVINFKPTTPGPLLQFSAGANPLYQCSIRHLGISSSNSIQKTAIEAIDMREFTIEDVGIYPWNGADSSIGVHLAGREFVRVIGSAIHADMPIVISPNPNSFISLDHSHFQDLHLIADAPKPVITIESGVNLSDVTFDGSQAWVKGTYGLYWVDHDSKMVSFGITFANVRREQAVDTNAYSLYISHHQHLQNLTISNFYCDLHQKGIFLAHASWVTITNLLYAGTHEAINALVKDNSHVVVTNSWFQRGAIIPAGSYPTAVPAGDGWVHDR